MGAGPSSRRSREPAVSQADAQRGVQPVRTGGAIPQPYNSGGQVYLNQGGGHPYPNPYQPRPANNGQFYGQFQAQIPPNAGAYVQHRPGAVTVPEQTQRTSTIRNDVNLKKASLKLVPSTLDPGRLVVQFQFDAAAACSVSCFFDVEEKVQEGCKLMAKMPVGPRVAFDKGLGQSYTQEVQWGLPLSRVDEGQGPCLLVVRMETITKEAPEGAQLPQPAGSPLPKWVQAQTTYATVSRGEEGEPVVRVLKQKIWVEAVSYELQEIYGIEQCASGASGSNIDEQGKECVICMSEPRDTTVLPCRHMCMCSGCARMLRHQTNRCPICRTTVEGLLEIKVERRAS